MQIVELPDGKLSSWNTSKLGLRSGADAISAVSAAVLAAPVVCIIDQSIMRTAATGTSLRQTLLSSTTTALQRPHIFLSSKPFLLVFALYSATYMTANSIDTLAAVVEDKKASSTTPGAAKFAATSSVNLTLCVYKDSQFVKMFGNPAAAAGRMPLSSYTLFAVRDAMTVFASFNLPALIAPRLAELPPVVKDKFSRILATESGCTNTAQFLTPAVVQLFSTPLHLLGLDLYNRQGKLGFSARTLQITKNWAGAAMARAARIIPPFGVGGVVNNQVRRGMMTKLE